MYAMDSRHGRRCITKKAIQTGMSIWCVAGTGACIPGSPNHPGNGLRNTITTTNLAPNTLASRSLATKRECEIKRFTKQQKESLVTAGENLEKRPNPRATEQNQQ